MSETIMILSPDSGREQDVEGSDLCAPFDLVTLLDPFAMLVDHGVDDVNEGLVAVEETVATRENVAFQPTFAGMLTEHLHNTTFHSQVSSILILLKVLAHPDLLACLVDLAKLVGLCLIRTEDAEIGHIVCDDVPKEFGHVGHAGKIRDTWVDICEGVLLEVWHVEWLLQ